MCQATLLLKTEGDQLLRFWDLLLTSNMLGLESVNIGNGLSYIFLKASENGIPSTLYTFHRAHHCELNI